VRLIRCYFCRSFKRSFGFFPRGYRIGLRIGVRPNRAPAQEASAMDIAVTVELGAMGGFQEPIRIPNISCVTSKYARKPRRQ
jgi:hypothetical protein